MDDYSGCNQIFLVEENVYKIAFRCSGAIDIFERLVMPFGLKNVDANY